MNKKKGRLFFDDLTRSEQNHITKLVASYVRTVHRRKRAMTLDEYKKKYLDILPQTHQSVFEFELAMMLSTKDSGVVLSPTSSVKEHIEIIQATENGPFPSEEEVLQSWIESIHNAQAARREANKLEREKKLH